MGCHLSAQLWYFKMAAHTLQITKSLWFVTHNSVSSPIIAVSVSLFFVRVSSTNMLQYLIATCRNYTRDFPFPLNSCYICREGQVQHLYTPKNITVREWR